MILRNHGLTPLAKLQNFLAFQSFGIDINLDGGQKNTVLYKLHNTFIEYVQSQVDLGITVRIELS